MKLEQLDLESVETDVDEKVEDKVIMCSLTVAHARKLHLRAASYAYMFHSVGDGFKSVFSNLLFFPYILTS